LPARRSTTDIGPRRRIGFRRSQSLDTRWVRASEGFFESFANLYTGGCGSHFGEIRGQSVRESGTRSSDARDGVCRVAFVESAMRSFTTGGAWTVVEAI
jgi:hypothetical protein